MEEGEEEEGMKLVISGRHLSPLKSNLHLFPLPMKRWRRRRKRRMQESQSKQHEQTRQDAEKIRKKELFGVESMKT